LPTPAVPPCIPWSAMQIVDPILGPRCAVEECLHDGGDIPPFAGINALGQLGGLNPTDTVAVYADSRGRPHIAVSNRVCICVPRFVVMRTENAPAGLGVAVEVEQANAATGQAEMRNREKLTIAEQKEHLAVFAMRERPSANKIVVGTRSVEEFLGGAI